METSEAVAAHALDRALEIQRIQLGKDGGTVCMEEVFSCTKQIATFMSEAGTYAEKRDNEALEYQAQIQGLQDQIVEMNAEIRKLKG